MNGLIRQGRVTRCWWCGDHEDYRAYHDEEWGRPVADDRHSKTGAEPAERARTGLEGITTSDQQLESVGKVCERAAGAATFGTARSGTVVIDGDLDCPVAALRDVRHRRCRLERVIGQDRNRHGRVFIGDCRVVRDIGDRIDRHGYGSRLGQPTRGHRVAEAVGEGFASTKPDDERISRVDDIAVNAAGGDGQGLAVGGRVEEGADLILTLTAQQDAEAAEQADKPKLPPYLRIIK